MTDPQRPGMPEYGTPEYEAWYAEHYAQQYADFRQSIQSPVSRWRKALALWRRLPRPARITTASIGGVFAAVIVVGVISAAVEDPDGSDGSGNAAPVPATATTHSKAPQHTNKSTASPSRTVTAASPRHSAVKKPQAPMATPPKPGTAAAALAALPVRPAASMDGYSRDAFGPAWADTDHDGCDTRNDVLHRDLAAIETRPGTHGCVVLDGTLTDRYTGKVIHFVRGEGTSEAVQIDHIVALGNAWQTGAQNLSAGEREQLANYQVELVAVDGPTNESKGEQDASTWLPENTAYQCHYVARQIAIKSAYHLWLTEAEKRAMSHVLATCPTLTLPSSAPWPAPSTSTDKAVAPPVVHSSAPPAPPAPPVVPEQPAPPAPPAPPAAPPAPPVVPPAVGVVHPGAFCSPEGATGVTTKGTPMVCGPASDGRNRWHSA